MQNRIRFDVNSEKRFLKFVNYSIKELNFIEHAVEKRIKISDNRLLGKNELISTVVVLEDILKMLEEKLECIKQQKREF